MTLLPFETHYARRRVLITGDTGFTGSWMAKWLQQIGATVLGVAVPPVSSPNLFQEAEIGRFVAHYDCDIRDADRLKTVFKDCKPDFVFHLAAQALVRQSYRDPLETYATNVMGTANVLDACRGIANLKGIVAITTDKVYRNNEWAWGYRETDTLGGKDPYSASKAACELVISSYRDSFFSKSDPVVPLAVARAGNIVGGGDWAEDRLIPDIVRALTTDTPLKLRNPKSTRPWQHVLSACHGYLLIGAGLIERPGLVADAWNFGPELADTRTVAEVVDAFGTSWKKPEIIHEPSPVAEAGPLMIDSQRARQILPWQPAWRFDETLVHATGWYGAYYGRQGSAAELCAADIAAYRLRLAAQGR
jgi:CDP-glucose 4,6-dehydratase